MKKYFFIIFAVIAFGCNKRSSDSAGQSEAVAQVQLLPADISQSLYQIKDPFVDQNGDTLHLSDLKGKPVVASMIYTTCSAACPRLVSDIQKVEKELGDEKNQVQFLLISFDTDFDSPKVLKEYAERHHLGDNWTLLRGSETSVRMLSVLLDVSFEKTDFRVFSHENKITLLDGNGIVRFQKEGLGNTAQPVRSALSQLLNH